MPPIPAENIQLFEQYKLIIEREIHKRRSRWHLDAINYMVWEDVYQILSLHVAQKIHLWDSRRPILNWLNRLLSNRFKNILRDVYGSFKRPCLDCEFFGGGSVCNKYIIQSSECSIFDKWNKGKRYKLEINMPQSIDANVPNEENDNIKKEFAARECTFLDFDKTIPEFNKLMMEKLKPVEWKVFSALFIDYKTDLETAKELGYKTEGEKDSTGVKAVAKIKTRIYLVAKEVVKLVDFH